jgi:uncharacterized membrane protein
MGKGSQFENAEIMVAIYNSESEAKATLDTLKQMEDQGTLDIIDAGTIEKKMDGKVHVHHYEKSAGKGALRGAAVGAVLGVIFPPSIIVSALGVGAAGGVIGHFRDTGMRNADLKQIGEEIQPGQGGVIAIVQDKSVQQLTNALSGYNKLFNQTLDAQMAAELAVVVDKATGEGVATLTAQEQQPMDTTGTSAGDTANPA